MEVIVGESKTVCGEADDIVIGSKLAKIVVNVVTEDFKLVGNGGVFVRISSVVSAKIDVTGRKL